MQLVQHMNALQRYVYTLSIFFWYYILGAERLTAVNPNAKNYLATEMNHSLR